MGVKLSSKYDTFLLKKILLYLAVIFDDEIKGNKSGDWKVTLVQLLSQFNTQTYYPKNPNFDTL